MDWCKVTATLFVRSRNGGWAMYSGEPAMLVERLDRTYAPAFVRLADEKIIGYTEECDGRCDNRRKHTWHAWGECCAPYAGMEYCPWTGDDE
jgi:hypothetical protein